MSAGVLDFGSQPHTLKVGAMGAWLKEHGLEVLIALFVVPMFWMVWDLRDRVGKLEEKGTQVENRVDRIAQSLPDIRAKVAYEAVFAPIKSAVLVTKPADMGNGILRVYAYSIDAGMGDVKTYYQDLSPKTIDAVYSGIKAKFYELDGASYPLSRVEQFSLDINNPYQAPSIVDSAASFLFYQEQIQTDEIMKALGMEQGNAVRFAPVKNWAKLSDYLNSTDWATYKAAP